MKRLRRGREICEPGEWHEVIVADQTRQVNSRCPLIGHLFLGALALFQLGSLIKASLVGNIVQSSGLSPLPPPHSIERRVQEITFPKMPPPQKLIPYKEAKIHSRYCYWKPEDNHLNDCHALMAPFLKGKPKWTLLGDSTMRLLYAFTEHLFPYKRKLGERCHQETYFGFPENNIDMWVPPNHSSSEGPVFFGAMKGNEFCSDCSGCASAKKAALFNRSLEFLSVEFARDVEVPTAHTKTTQETVALYLDQEVSSATDHVCVVNTGLHGMTVFNDTSKYVENNRWYIDQLLGSKCGSLVWISISATLELPPYGNLNWKLKEWNDSFREVLRVEYPQVFYVDIWDKSAVTEHNDNVHLKNKEFYEPLADTLFVSLMQPNSIHVLGTKLKH